MSLGSSLYHARKKSGLTQENVAEKLGVSRQTISKWETNETLPDIRQSKGLAMLYHMTLDELIEYDFDEQQAQQMIDSVSDEAQARIDWNKVWSKKYPVLATYHKTVRINDYAPALREMLTQLRVDYGYNHTDALRDRCDSSAASSLPLVEIRLNGILPVGIQGGAAPNSAHRLADGLVVELSALTVAVVVHRPVRANAQLSRRLHGVDVGPQEEKLPAAPLLLPLNHLSDLLGGIAVAGVLHAVGGDDKEGVFRHIRSAGIFMDVSNVVNGSAQSIQQSGTSPDVVLLAGDGPDLLHLHPVVEHFGAVVKEDGGDKRLTRLLLLLFQHGIEAADGVPLQPLHGAAAVQNKYQLGQILVHKNPPILCGWLTTTG